MRIKIINNTFFTIINNFVKVYLLFLLIKVFNVSYSQADTLILDYSKQGGIYTKHFPLSIKSNIKKSVIYYTTDGSIPTNKSRKFTDSIIINTTKVVRAIAILNKLKSAIISHSYILENRKFNLPVVSICVDPKKMFNNYSGLYMKGPNASSKAPYKGANFFKDKELEINIEYFDTSHITGFNQKAGLKIFGGYSRGLPQKSFSIISRKKYGQKNFKYPLYPNLKYKKYKSFILRNSGSDNNRSHFRDVLMTSLVKPLSFDIQEYNTCVVFINGEYFGIYNIREKFNEHYIEKHHKINKDSVSIMKHRNDLKIGKRLNYKKIVSFLLKNDFSLNTNIDSLNKLIDINNFLDYNISETYFANTDAGGNIRYWRSWHKNSRWRWLMFDTDFGFGMDGKTAYKKNTVKDFTKKSREIWPIPAWSTLFIRKLLENDSIKEVYIRKFTTNLNTILEPNTVLNEVNKLTLNIDYEIDYQHKRWGSNRTRWNKEINRITEFAKYRPFYIRKYLQEKFELKDTFLVEILKPINGQLEFNYHSISTNFKGIYFSDITNYIKAKPNFNYDLNNWIGLKGNKEETNFILKENKTIEAIFTKKKKSKFYNKIKFTEIQIKGKNTGDWLELYNSSNEAIELTNWIFLRNNNKQFVIDTNVYIKPNEYLIFSKKDGKVDKKYKIKAIKYLFSIRDTSIIELYTPNGNLVDSINLSSTKHTKIQLKDLTLQSSDITNWIKSKKATPGSINRNEKQKNEFKILFLYGILPLLGLILLFSIIFLIKKKLKR